MQWTLYSGIVSEVFDSDHLNFGTAQVVSALSSSISWQVACTANEVMVSYLIIMYVVLSRPETASLLRHLFESWELLRKVEPLLAIAMTAR